MAQRAAILHESHPGRLWSLPPLRTGASTSQAKSSPENLLQLALGASETRRPAPLLRPLLSPPSHNRLSPQPHPPRLAPRTVEAHLLTCVAVSRHSKLQIKRPIAAHRESKIRRPDDIARRRRNLHLKRSAIEREHQWSGSSRRSGSRRIHTLARRQMQSARRTNLHRAPAVQCNVKLYGL
jgi:hypothetical protein